MIDNATIEQWMREANPIPDVDEVDADEFARFVAAAHTRRAATMQAPTQHPTPTTPVTSPPQRRRKVWAFAAAFILMIVAVGVAALVTRGGGEAPVSDEPMAPVTVTTLPPTSAPLEGLDGWRPVATPAWGGIDHLEPLPGGGYVARGRDRSDLFFVMWSPNGVDWFDGDPQRLLGRVQSLAAVGEQVAVLHDSSQNEQDEIPLSIGDPRTGTWKRVPLDVTGIAVVRPEDGPPEGDLRLVSLAANDEEVLVAAYAAPAPNAEGQEVESTQVMAWLVDAARATSTRNSSPIPATPSENVPPLVEWVEERWIMIAPEDAVGPEGDEPRSTLWTSPDGRAWSQVAMPEGMDGVHSVRAGPSGVAASTCGFGSRASEPPEDGFWYSSDGLDWSLVPRPGGHNPVIASWGDRGFVVGGTPDDSATGVDLIASDGSGMELMPSPFKGASAAAASGDTLIVSPSGSGLWLYQEPTYMITRRNNNSILSV